MRGKWAVARSGVTDDRGTLLCETDLEELWGDVGECRGITRVRLREVLLRGAAQQVPHRLGVALTALTVEPDHVSCAFRDGSSADYPLVVGADGIGSAVRRP